MQLNATPDIQLSLSKTEPYIFPSELENVTEARIPVQLAEHANLDNLDPRSVVCKFGKRIVLVHPENYEQVMWLDGNLIDAAFPNREFVSRLLVDRIKVINAKFSRLNTAFAFIDCSKMSELFKTIRAIEAYLPTWQLSFMAFQAEVHGKSCDLIPFTVNSDNPFHRIFMDTKTPILEKTSFLSTRISVEYFTGRRMIRTKPKKEISALDFFRWKSALSVNSILLDLKNAGRAPQGLGIPEAIFSYTKVVNEFAIPKYRIYSERRSSLATALSCKQCTNAFRDRIAFQISSAVNFLHTYLKIAHNNIELENIEVNIDSMNAYLVGFEYVTVASPFPMMGVDPSFGSSPNSPVEEVELMHPRDTSNEPPVLLPIQGYVVNPVSRDQWQLGLTLLILANRLSVPFWDALLRNEFQRFYRAYDVYLKTAPKNIISEIARRLLERAPGKRMPINEAVKQLEKAYKINGEMILEFNK